MKRPKGYMDTNLAKRIIRELTENDICKRITPHILGEPTLHPDFFEILEFALEIGSKISLTTNGIGLNDEVGKRLLDYNLDQIDISLQTPNEESFSYRNSKDISFHEYADGILNFFSEYKKRNPKTLFKFRFLNTIYYPPKMRERIGQIKVLSSEKE